MLSYLRAQDGGMRWIANILLSSMVAEDVNIMVSRYWQIMCWREIQHYLRGVHWCKVQQWKSVTISKECTGAGCKNGRAQLLVWSALVQGANNGGA
jgi:hypothetical protein